MLDRPRVGSGKKDGWLAQGGEFAVETRGQGTVDMCGVDERLAGSGFSGREEPWQEKGLKDEEKKGQSLEEDEGAWCQWAYWSLNSRQAAVGAVWMWSRG